MWKTVIRKVTENYVLAPAARTVRQARKAGRESLCTAPPGRKKSHYLLCVLSVFPKSSIYLLLRRCKRRGGVVSGTRARMSHLNSRAGLAGVLLAPGVLYSSSAVISLRIQRLARSRNMWRYVIVASARFSLKLKDRTGMMGEKIVLLPTDCYGTALSWRCRATLPPRLTPATILTQRELAARRAAIWRTTCSYRQKGQRICAANCA